MSEPIHPAACSHEHGVYRKKVDAAGRPYAVVQCTDCGHWGKGVGGQARPLAELRNKGISDVSRLKPFDQEAFDRAALHLARAKREAERLQKQVARVELIDEQYERYQAYLRTAEWASIRQAVLKRAEGVCEGCMERPATQVHHLTYEHLFAEFMWELRAVCEPCHLRIHREQHGARTMIREVVEPYQGPVGPLLAKIVNQIEVREQDHGPVAKPDEEGESAA